MVHGQLWHRSSLSFNPRAIRSSPKYMVFERRAAESATLRGRWHGRRRERLLPRSVRLSIGRRPTPSKQIRHGGRVRLRPKPRPGNAPTTPAAPDPRTPVATGGFLLSFLRIPTLSCNSLTAAAASGGTEMGSHVLRKLGQTARRQAMTPTEPEPTKVPTSNELAQQRTTLADVRTHQADERTSLALDRTRLAHERTLMAWIRTAMSLISFGFTIYKFFQGLEDTEKIYAAHRMFGPRGLCARHDRPRRRFTGAGDHPAPRRDEEARRGVHAVRRAAALDVAGDWLNRRRPGHGGAHPRHPAPMRPRPSGAPVLPGAIPRCLFTSRSERRGRPRVDARRMTLSGQLAALFTFAC